MTQMREFFTASAIAQLRQRLCRHLRQRGHHPPSGWSKVTADLGAVARELRHLQLKPGLALLGYQYFDAKLGCGKSAIYAMPQGCSLPEVDDCPWPGNPLRILPDPPAPPNALGHFMEGFEGDRSPSSFIGASVFTRELADFTGHRFAVWPMETVLDSDPFAEGRPKPEGRWETPRSDRSRWTWHEPPPMDWRPCVQVNEDGSAVVQFFTYFPPGIQTLRRHTDSYPPASYRAGSHLYTVAEGPMGFHW